MTTALDLKLQKYLSYVWLETIPGIGIVTSTNLAANHELGEICTVCPCGRGRNTSTLIIGASGF